MLDDAESTDVLDYLVVGAGPAGLQIAHLLHRAGRSYLVLEKGEHPGAFFTQFPRHRTMISNNKRFVGSDDPELHLKMDWNSLLSDDPDLLFTRYTEEYFPPADQMVRYLRDFAERWNLRIACGRTVTRVSRNRTGFRVVDDRGDTHRARRLVIATGVSKPNTPDIPGIELAEHYPAMPVDPDDFTDQRVLIVGKGNSAFETADNLVGTAAIIHVAGPKPVRLAWHTHFVGHVRAVNNNFLDTYQLKAQNAVLNVGVAGIGRSSDGRYRVDLRFTRGIRTVEYDRVLVCTGFRFDPGIFTDDCSPELMANGRFPELTGGYESVNVNGLFFAGTITQGVDYRHGTSGFIHGFRYGARALHRLLEQRFHDTGWTAAAEVAPEPAELADSMLARATNSSGLWQQFGVLADLVVVPENGPARYHQEVPLRYLDDGGLPEFGADRGDAFALLLTFGPDPADKIPFDGTIIHATESEISAYFHPVVRHYRDGAFVDEHHLASEMENDWTQPDEHVEPLRKFLSDALGARVDAGAGAL